mgnify:CR=1 FL=1
MRGDRERVLDMLDACRMLRTHLGGSREQLESDPVAQAAAQRWNEIIGEAASRLSPSLREAQSSGPVSCPRRPGVGTKWEHDPPRWAESGMAA